MEIKPTYPVFYFESFKQVLWSFHNSNIVLVRTRLQHRQSFLLIFFLKIRTSSSLHIRLSIIFLTENQDKAIVQLQRRLNFLLIFFQKIRTNSNLRIRLSIIFLTENQDKAIASISITAPFGIFATSRADLAGLWSPKNSS